MVIGNQTRNDAEQRFSHLLQPIRDLSKNWDIDIAGYLDEYLEELESVAITFDGGATTMNFAEAALLIQGSACVYSRKVEFLCTLVYQVLDLLTNKNSKKVTSVDENGNDTDADFHDDEDEQFLSLDDIVKPGNVNMKEGEGAANKSIHPVPRTPLSLVVMDEGTKGENPLLSKSGEVLASRNDFKMNTCYVHPSGSILLDSAHTELLELSLKLLASSTPYTSVPAEKKMGVCVEDDNIDLAPVDCQEADMSDNCGYDDLQTEETDNHIKDFNKKEEEEVIVRKSERRRVQLIPPKPVVDPWNKCDPHDLDDKPVRPFKKGRVLKIDSVTRKKRKRNSKIKETPDVPVSKFIAEAIYYQSLKGLQKIKMSLYPELERLYWTEMKRRQSEFEKEKTLMISRGLEAENEEEEEIETFIGENEPVTAGLFVDDDDAVDDIGLQTDHNLLYPENEPLIHAEGEPQDDIEFEKDVLVNSYEDLVRKHVEAYMVGAQEYAQITEVSQRVAEWEEKILPKLRQEESREPFDIHKYGTRVIENLKMNSKIPFKNIVHGCQKFEICRLFLATLQLANVGNVLILCDGVLEEGMDSMLLELLTKKRHHEELADYQAPSMK